MKFYNLVFFLISWFILFFFIFLSSLYFIDYYFFFINGSIADERIAQDITNTLCEVGISESASVDSDSVASLSYGRIIRETVSVFMLLFLVIDFADLLFNIFFGE